ncbi:MAG: FtsX-like permease family protein [Verrucomicrobiota bacterium]|nr:FtsX-like permease family protein [Verrucomicrobiota bacterium]
MTPPLYIALRFLGHRKRAFFLSLLGVVFGLSIFICTQAQTQGFARRFIQSTLGSNGALVLSEPIRPSGSGLPVPPKGASGKAAASHRRIDDGISNVREIMRVSQEFTNVASCSPVLRGTLSARAGFQNATVDLWGIDAGLHLQTTNLKDEIIEGSLDAFRNDTSSLIVGPILASRLNIAAGDSLQLLAPNGEYWRFTVAAIAQSGVGAIDSGRMYAHTKIAQALLHKPYAATMIIYKLRDTERAPALAARFQSLFQHEAESWQEREAGNLQLFLTLRMSAAITVSLIILLAGFGIYNVLTLSVLSKVKEIAILRSIGYRQRDIGAIFLWQGAMIAAAGSVLGCSGGALMTWAVSQIPIRVRGLLVADHFLVAWDWRNYLWGIVLGTIAVLIASYVPARRAAALQPVETLRGSGA